MLHCHLESYTSPVANDMKDNMYVDNVISGCDQETEVVHYYEEARSIMKEANFNLRSWATNSPLLREQTEEDQTSDSNTVVNILGLRWGPLHDTLHLTPKETILPPSQHVSKCNVLQVSSKTYDPLGYLSPVTVKAKLLIQELWQKKLEWDELLPTDLTIKWNDIAGDIQEASKLILPRCFFPQYRTDAHPIYLHVFADASPMAYGTVANISTGDQSSFVMVKSRVAPLKTLTLPQLELMAALICTRLAHFISGALKSRFPNLIIKMWSDSEIVLHWLYSTKPLKQFLANRTQEIKKLFPVTVWNHCPTHDNPADLLTRGINTTHLHASSLWKHGPQWLPFEKQWPSWTHLKILHLQLSDPTEMDNTDTVTTKVNATADGATQTDPVEKELGIHHVINASRYSTLSKLLAVTSIRFPICQELTEPCVTSSGTTVCT